MTGRDLIVYILTNNLEDEPIFKDGTFIGFVSVEEAAIKMGVDVPTIYTLIALEQLHYIKIGETYLIRTDYFKK